METLHYSKYSDIIQTWYLMKIMSDTVFIIIHSDWEALWWWLFLELPSTVLHWYLFIVWLLYSRVAIQFIIYYSLLYSVLLLFCVCIIIEK